MLKPTYLNLENKFVKILNIVFVLFGYFCIRLFTLTVAIKLLQLRFNL